MAKGKAKNNPELDKNYIYNLIMPSPPPAQTETSPEEAEEEPAPVSPSPAETAEDSGADPAAELKERLFARQTAGVSLPPARKEYVLVNLTELLVADRLDAALEKFTCCKCDKCRKDAAAYALNLLTPEYVAAESSQIQKLLETCDVNEVAGAIVKAILYVRSHPKH